MAEPRPHPGDGPGRGAPAAAPTVEAPFGKALAALGAQAAARSSGSPPTSANTPTSCRSATPFPDRFFNVGMAEQNLVAVAAGLARTGKIPFATTYGVFATRRAYDFIAIAVRPLRGST